MSSLWLWCLTECGHLSISELCDQDEPPHLLSHSGKVLDSGFSIVYWADICFLLDPFLWPQCLGSFLLWCVPPATTGLCWHFPSLPLGCCQWWNNSCNHHHDVPDVQRAHSLVLNSCGTRRHRKLLSTMSPTSLPCNANNDM